MKNFIVLVLVNLIFTSMLAQVEINLRDARGTFLYEKTDPTYFIDSFNDLDKFVGNWSVVDGNKRLEVSIQKLIRVPRMTVSRTPVPFHYEDVIDVSYKLYENNVLTINYNTTIFPVFTVRGNTFPKVRLVNGPRTSNILNHIFLSYYEPSSNGSCLRSRDARLQLTYQDVASVDTQGNAVTGELFWRIIDSNYYSAGSCSENDPTDTGSLRNLSDVTLIRD